MKKHFTKERMDEIGSLKKDEVRIIAIRPTKTNDKVQVVFMQQIERAGNVNLLGRANKGDDRFSDSSARVFWITFSMEGIKDMFPDLLDKAKEAIETGDYVKADVVNPAVDGRTVCIQLNETHRASQRDIENLELSAKQAGKGNYLMKEGLAIFERPILTFKDVAQHQFINHDSTTKDIADLDFVTATYDPTAESDEAQTTEGSNESLVEDDVPEEEESTEKATA